MFFHITDCLVPTQPAGGTVTFTTTTYLSTLTYACNTGFTLSAGSASATCTEASSWNNGPPTCTIDGEYYPNLPTLGMFIEHLQRQMFIEKCASCASCSYHAALEIPRWHLQRAYSQIRQHQLIWLYFVSIWRLELKHLAECQTT